jgi:hypothetical protein
MDRAVAVLLVLLAAPCEAAITRHGSASLGLISSSTYSASYTVGSGSDRLLTCAFFGGTSDDITGITYAGVAMTVIHKSGFSGDRWLYSTYLAAPASGPNTLSASVAGGVAAAICSDYDGVSAVGSTGNGGGFFGPATATVTLSDAGSWVVAFGRETSGGAITWTSAVALQTPGNGLAMADSNAAVGFTGGHSVTMDSGSSIVNLDVAEIVPTGGGGGGPSGGGGAACPAVLTLLRVGCGGD